MHKYLTSIVLFLLFSFFAIFVGDAAMALDGDAGQPGDWAKINLTDTELQWLGQKNVIRLGVGVRFFPIMYVTQDQGKPMLAGMVADYVKLFEHRLGVTMKPVYGIDFKEALELGRQGKIDLFPCVSKTPEREDFLVYTKPYLDFKLVIITRKDYKPVSNLKDLMGQRIAVIKELSTYGILKQDYPDLNFAFVKDFNEAFESLSMGRVDAYICNMVVASYYIQKMGLLNLKIAGPAPYESDKLRVGVRKDLGILLGIMDKVVASISPEERQRIKARWVTVHFDSGVDWHLILWVSAAAALVVIMVLGLVLSWNKSLSREVEARKLAESAAKDSEQNLRDLVNSSPDLICFKDADGRWKEANEKILEEYLLSDIEYHGKTNLELADYSPFFRGALQRCVDTDELTWRAGRLQKFEEVIPSIDGPAKTIEFLKMPTYNSDGGKKAIIVVGRDITARKRTEVALRDSEEKYRRTFESISDAITITRMNDGKFLFINDGFVRQTGWLGREVLGRTPLDLGMYANPDDRNKVLTLLRIGGEVLDMQVRMRRKSGEVYYVALTAKTMEYGGEDCIIAQLRDVTVRVEAVTALARSEEIYRNLVDNSPLGVFQATVAGRYKMANPAFAQMLGFDSPQQLIDEVDDISALYVDQNMDKDTREHLLQTLGADFHFSGYELNMHRRDGSEVWLNVFAKPIMDANGQVAYLDGFALDITENKLAQAAAQESKRQFEVTFEQAAVGLSHASPDGTILRLNKKLCDMWGYQREELINRNVFELVHPEDMARSKANAELMISGKLSNYTTQERNVRKDGSIIWINLTVSMVCDEDGKPAYALGVVEDITERKRAEDEKAELELQLRQSKKMQAIGTLAGGVAHDFNNILAAIMGYSELALNLQGSGRQCDNEVKEILRAADRAKELVQQILTFSRKVEVDLKPMDLNQEVVHTTKILGRTLPKMIELRTTLGSSLPLIKADATQIEQVLLNLASNAADAMPEGGTLAIETSQVELDREYCRRHLEITPGQYILLEVSDTGTGMDEQTLQLIFDPFFTTKEIGKGTGLGLSTAFGTVKEHGGHIHCFSELGKGTTFKIYLPVLGMPEPVPVSDSQPLPDAAEEPEGGEETILLVDDEQALRKLGRSILTDAGYSVLTAKDGEEALDVYNQNMDSIDLVILDLSMPGMGGYKCLALLLAANPRAKVIVASGYSANTTAKDTIRAGAVGFLSKPFRSEELLERIRLALDA